MIMPATAEKESLLLHFPTREGKHAVTKKTLTTLKGLLGFSEESQVIQYALASLRDRLMPRYKADNGPIPAAMLEHIRKSVSQSTTDGQALALIDRNPDTVNLLGMPGIEDVPLDLPPKNLE
jgi:hypothetical protein